MSLLNRLEQRVSSLSERAIVAGVELVGSAIDAGEQAIRSARDTDEITIEGLMLVLVRTSRDARSDGPPTSREAIRKAYENRQRFTRIAARIGPLGAASALFTSLYTEAGILGDVAELNGLALSDEDLGAYLLVHWAVIPDFTRAKAAMDGVEGLSAIDALRDRLEPLASKKEIPKVELVKFVWKMRSGRKGAGSGKDPLDSMINHAEFTLGVASPAAGPSLAGRLSKRLGSIGAPSPDAAPGPVFQRTARPSVLGGDPPEPGSPPAAGDQ